MNTTRATQPYGPWPSPITASDVAAGTRQLDEVRLDGASTYWLESRPGEGGRVTLMRHDGGSAVDVLPEGGRNVRSRVHEMGGGAYAVADGTVVFSSFADNRLYRVDPSGTPVPITPEAEVRYGGLVLHGAHVYAVREDHRTGGEPRNELVRLDVAGPNADLGAVLATGTDFVGAPAVSPTGSTLAWITWDHPSMPWDSTTLWTAETTAEGIAEPRRVAGGEGVSVVQPAYAADGRLWFVSDETGWWTLWRTTDTGIDLALDVTADLAEPQWLLGRHDFAPLPDGRLLIRDPEAPGGPAIYQPAGGAVEAIEDAVAARTGSLVASGAAVAFLSEPADRPAEVLRIEGDTVVVVATGGPAPDPAFVPAVEEVSWTNSSGLTAYGFFYPPTHPDVAAPEDERPPLLVFVHGGPTSRSDPVESPQKRFWTSRGFAVLDVNHGGSTGFGRAYRERLDGQWGVVDIDDIVTGARAMAERGLADGERMAIRGGSAGGYATLRALTTSDAFAAGTCYFGISDLRTLVADTHKFESRYCDRLIGPLPGAEEVYAERSPINHLDDLHGELLMLQGADDLIVPLSQARAMAEAMRAAGKPVELVVYDGEGHGFRRRETVVDALERELAHYGRVFGFDPGS